MTGRARRLLLLAFIALELLGAAILLWWLLGPPDKVQQAQPVETPVPTVEQELQPTGVWVTAGIPPPLVGAIRDWVAQQPGELAWVEPAEAELTVDWEKRARAHPLAEIVLVPVAPFPSSRDDVTIDELRRTWLGRSRSGDRVAHLVASPETATILDALFGARDAGSPLTIVPADDLTDRLWNQPDALGIVPFDQLEPRLKALAVDGQSALDRDLDLRHYPLVARIWTSGPGDLERALVATVEKQGLATNRHPDRLTVLVMTGVTALARGVALQMEARGDYGWPARSVADLLSAADLTHVSNEVSFVPGCQAEADTWVFCAKPEYMETLHLVGADLVELTGNHNLDFGAYPALQSLDLYDEAGMHTFGGGRNTVEARQPLLITHNGNRLAFLGYNQFGPDYAWASEEGPGAARFSLEAVRADLAQIRPQVDLILVSIQHTETYDTVPLPEQAADFQAVARSGADIVTGSQAHQPQAVEFLDGKPIFYGLGNLFFDQTWSESTRQGLVVRHFIYNGRLISSQLIPTTIDDNFQTHLVEGEKQKTILKTVFDASNW